MIVLDVAQDRVDAGLQLPERGFIARARVVVDAGIAGSRSSISGPNQNCTRGWTGIVGVVHVGRRDLRLRADCCVICGSNNVLDGLL